MSTSSAPCRWRTPVKYSPRSPPGSRHFSSACPTAKPACGIIGSPARPASCTIIRCSSPPIMTGRPKAARRRRQGRRNIGSSRASMLRRSSCPRSATGRSRAHSYQEFRKAKAAGMIAADTRFQVCLPTPLAFILGIVAPECRDQSLKLAESALRHARRFNTPKAPQTKRLFPFCCHVRHTRLRGLEPRRIWASLDHLVGARRSLPGPTWSRRNNPLAQGSEGVASGTSCMWRTP